MMSGISRIGTCLVLGLALLSSCRTPPVVLDGSRDNMELAGVLATEHDATWDLAIAAVRDSETRLAEERRVLLGQVLEGRLDRFEADQQRSFETTIAKWREETLEEQIEELMIGPVRERMNALRKDAKDKKALHDANPNDNLAYQDYMKATNRYLATFSALTKAEYKVREYANQKVAETRTAFFLAITEQRSALKSDLERELASLARESDGGGGEEPASETVAKMEEARAEHKSRHEALADGLKSVDSYLVRKSIAGLIFKGASGKLLAPVKDFLKDKGLPTDLVDAFDEKIAGWVERAELKLEGKGQSLLNEITRGVIKEIPDVETDARN